MFFRLSHDNYNTKLFKETNLFFFFFCFFFGALRVREKKVEDKVTTILKVEEKSNNKIEVEINKKTQGKHSKRNCGGGGGGEQLIIFH